LQISSSHMYYIPTYSSWLNQENRLFRAALQPFESDFPQDRNGRFDPAQDRPTLFVYFRDTTLASSLRKNSVRDSRTKGDLPSSW
jgi:hypothetical protein